MHAFILLLMCKCVSFIMVKILFGGFTVEPCFLYLFHAFGLINFLAQCITFFNKYLLNIIKSNVVIPFIQPTQAVRRGRRTLHRGSVINRVLLFYARQIVGRDGGVCRWHTSTRGRAFGPLRAGAAKGRLTPHDRADRRDLGPPRPCSRLILFG